MKKTCFIVSAIGDEGTDIRKRADLLFKHILNPICEKCEFTAVRVDQINKADSITQTIIDYLNTAELVIADLTGHNPNAFYEIGYRASTRKPIVHMKQKGEIIPFDIAAIRTLDYDLSDLDSVEELKSRLEQTINSFNFSNTEDNNQNDTSGSNFSQILPILYEIYDNIDDLKNEIKKKDVETIQAVVKASIANTPPSETSEELMMKLLLPELIKNPEAADSLLALSEKFNKGK